MIETNLLTGNEAVAIGAIESDVEFVASYPGTPSTEITEALIDLKKKLCIPIHVEWSINEKVAFEAAYGASLVGLRSLVGVKHLGMNVLSDSLVVAALSGTNGGLVIVCVDDTHPYSSQVAIDSRYYSLLSNLPLLEPSSPKEARELTKLSFKLSEDFKLPFILRLTQRVAHGFEKVEIDRIEWKGRRMGKFQPNPKYVLLPSMAFNRKRWLERQMNKLAKIIDHPIFAPITYSSGNKLGIIGVGVGATLAYTLQRRLKISRVKILKLLVTNPLPQHQILKFAKSVEKILVLEDGDPIVESKIKNLLFTYGINRKIMGKESGDIKKVGELTPGSFLFLRSLKVGRNYSFTPKEMAGFCAGCPHRASFYVIKEVRKIWEKRYGNRIIIIGDRGCYNQGAKPPFNCMDVCMNMGSSIGISYGLSKSGIGNPIIAIIGDSTFFHSGIPPLLNSLFEGGKICVVVLDNECTAMTGGQPNPSSRISSTGEKRSKIFIEELLRGLNIKYIDVINPFEIEKAKKSLLNALMSKEMSIIIFRQTCAEQERKLLKTDEVRYEINNSKCKKCKKCINEIGCPAIRVEGNNIFIDPSVCTGCGLCVSICPFSAIRRI